jgi:prevent-host-death family protein
VEREQTVGADAPVPAEEARARLGALVEEVATGGRMVPLTVDGAPAGALVPISAMDDYHLAPRGGVRGVAAARAAWAATRRRAEEAGPVLLTTRGDRAALLVSPQAADAVAAGLELASGDVEFDGEHIWVGGRAMAPGIYALPGGGRLTVADAPTDDDDEDEE